MLDSMKYAHSRYDSPPSTSVERHRSYRSPPKVNNRYSSSHKRHVTERLGHIRKSDRGSRSRSKERYRMSKQHHESGNRKETDSRCKESKYRKEDSEKQSDWSNKSGSSETYYRSSKRSHKPDNGSDCSKKRKVNDQSEDNRKREAVKHYEIRKSRCSADDRRKKSDEMDGNEASPEPTYKKWYEFEIEKPNEAQLNNQKTANLTHQNNEKHLLHNGQSPTQSNSVENEIKTFASTKWDTELKSHDYSKTHNPERVKTKKVEYSERRQSPNGKGLLGDLPGAYQIPSTHFPVDKRQRKSRFSNLVNVESQKSIPKIGLVRIGGEVESLKVNVSPLISSPARPKITHDISENVAQGDTEGCIIGGVTIDSDDPYKHLASKYAVIDYNHQKMDINNIDMHVPLSLEDSQPYEPYFEYHGYPTYSASVSPNSERVIRYSADQQTSFPSSNASCASPAEMRGSTEELFSNQIRSLAELISADSPQSPPPVVEWNLIKLDAPLRVALSLEDLNLSRCTASDPRISHLLNMNYSSLC